MSIIGAIVSYKGGITGSDGRKHTSAVINGDIIVKPSEVETDEFDKTFRITNNLIGAFCGLLFFNKKNISEHIADIHSRVISYNKNFKDVVQRIADELNDMVNKIPDSEVMPQYRKVDILIVGIISKGKMGAAKIRLPFSDENNIQPQIRKITKKSGNQYFLFGDDDAQKHAKKILDVNNAKNNDICFMKTLLRKALENGIKNSGISPFSSNASCGGKVFWKQTI
ncbi:MAG: hypothetical protein HQK83_19940 [Fibrobacteria bacterium]|nr:hypothetical protein [Fibrobacteria bacterium]